MDYYSYSFSSSFTDDCNINIRSSFFTLVSRYLNDCNIHRIVLVSRGFILIE